VETYHITPAEPRSMIAAVGESLGLEATVEAVEFEATRPWWTAWCQVGRWSIKLTSENLT
jgi:hypothetical protein